MIVDGDRFRVVAQVMVDSPDSYRTSGSHFCIILL